MNTIRTQRVSGNAADNTQSWAAHIFQLITKLGDVEREIDGLEHVLKRHASSNRSNARGSTPARARTISTRETRAVKLMDLIHRDIESMRRNIGDLSDTMIPVSETVGITSPKGRVPRTGSRAISVRTPVPDKDTLAFLKQVSAAKNAISNDTHPVTPSRVRKLIGIYK